MALPALLAPLAGALIAPLMRIVLASAAVLLAGIIKIGLALIAIVLAAWFFASSEFALGLFSDLIEVVVQFLVRIVGWLGFGSAIANAFDFLATTDIVRMLYVLRLPDAAGVYFLGLLIAVVVWVFKKIIPGL